MGAKQSWFDVSQRRGIEQDYQKAVKWYRKAAEQGLHLAHYNLGLMYEFGNGVGQNYKKAYIGYSLAVLFGDGNKAIDKRIKLLKNYLLVS